MIPFQKIVLSFQSTAEIHSNGSSPGKNLQHFTVQDHPLLHNFAFTEKMMLWDFAFKKGNGNSLHSTPPKWCHCTKLCWHEVFRNCLLTWSQFSDRHWTDKYHRLVCDHAMDFLHKQKSLTLSVSQHSHM